MSIDDNLMKEQFIIRFDVASNQIDSNTFVNYLIHFNSVIQEINNDLARD
ncbi:hypothetical protein J2Y45_005475 [Dyadobacter sp. BE34]|uniref:Uncharacterized protein n=1 Tax=Dyadobacter fermentans TaxID=94254 RepID=A0ABU1R445_9BACT|nr:hypothetical protein [Dyadobacter fermentans]MDR7046008.1 hypothetical protein [Dyadobacter sp. BE242]MDR7200321.1 hypothetical protein [Dyadobacter sp. BE34]MDR7218281.1 hypothetical protein [Dyadobacter sp. BE31]MDR7266212.1 hypothetical protein [Dyadobacter sp. BE32]